jgi:glyoxylase-like metal-dependent hydrolase (beta-lactamase superfamily II)
MNDAVDRLIDERPGFAAMEPAHENQALFPVADGIWGSAGTSNAYMVLTGAGRVIINTGMGFEALVHKPLFDAVSPGSTPYILLTQGHVDHVGGVRHFRAPETRLVAQANNAACQHDDARIQKVRSSQAYIWFQKTIDSAIEVAKKHPEVFVQDTPVPDITFDDHYAFNCGGVEFELYATPGGETLDSCVVWLPQRRILFSGNVFGPLFPHFPNVNTIRGDKYRDLERYLQSLRRIRDLEPELLVTGHFTPVAGRELIRACLDRLEAAVEYVYSETLQGMNAGKDIFTLMREVQLPPALRVGEGYGKVSWAVRTVWESTMGWFKAQATSELYATQPREVYADLVELAGIAAVIARGEQKLASGDPEAALLLAEAALTADKHDRGALQLALAAHEALLARAGDGNFWESGWLRHQIAQLQNKLAKAG